MRDIAAARKWITIRKEQSIARKRRDRAKPPVRCRGVKPKQEIVGGIGLQEANAKRGTADGCNQINWWIVRVRITEDQGEEWGKL